MKYCVIVRFDKQAFPLDKDWQIEQYCHFQPTGWRSPSSHHLIRNNQLDSCSLRHRFGLGHHFPLVCIFYHRFRLIALEYLLVSRQCCSGRNEKSRLGLLRCSFFRFGLFGSCFWMILASLTRLAARFNSIIAAERSRNYQDCRRLFQAR